MTHVRVTSAFMFSFFVCFPHLLCGSVFAFAFSLFSFFLPFLSNIFRSSHSSASWRQCDLLHNLREP